MKMSRHDSLCNVYHFSAGCMAIPRQFHGIVMTLMMMRRHDGEKVHAERRKQGNTHLYTSSLTLLIGRCYVLLHMVKISDIAKTPHPSSASEDAVITR